MAVKVDAQPAPKTERSIAIVEVNGYNITGILSDDSGKGIAVLFVLMLAGIIIMIIGYIGKFAANVIRMAISRQKEYLEGTATIAAVKLMCNDKWKKKGVFSPASFDSRIFYEALEAEGIEVKESDSKPLL